MAKPTKTTTPPVRAIDLAELPADLDKSNDGTQRNINGRWFMHSPRLRN